MSGTLEIPQAINRVEPSTRDAIDEALRDLQKTKDAWVAQDLDTRIALLEELTRSVVDVSEDWVKAGCEAKGLEYGTPRAAEEWNGPALTVRMLRLLRSTLADIKEHGAPQLPGEPTTRADGTVVVPVLPTFPYDRILFKGGAAEVWMQPEVTLANLEEHIAGNYRGPSTHEGQVALVLGAGNQAAIPPTDVLTKLFHEDQVVALKMNPVNEYLGPIFEEAFAPLIDAGFLRLVYGGAEEGAYLTDHADVDSIHMTGSDKTHDAIVFGTGEEGERRKAEGRPRITKPMTSELGNVTPVIVVPGPWSESDIDYQARSIATMLVQNAGFNCIAARAVITHSQWSGRRKLIDGIRTVLSESASREPYYPGAEQRHQRFVEAHPDAEQFGPRGEGKVPWTFIPELDAEADDEIAFSTEAFCGVFGEVPLDAPRDVASYLDQAVEFCNERLWGTLGAVIIVHPRSLKDPEVERALDRAIGNLRYGSITINEWVAMSFALMCTSWGAYPGHDLQDIQSGIGTVHNAYLFDRPQKSVVWAPFRQYPPPFWHVGHGMAHEVARRWMHLEADPSLKHLPGLMTAAMRA